MGATTRAAWATCAATWRPLPCHGMRARFVRGRRGGRVTSKRQERARAKHSITADDQVRCGAARAWAELLRALPAEHQLEAGFSVSHSPVLGTAPLACQPPRIPLRRALALKVDISIGINVLAVVQQGSFSPAPRELGAPATPMAAVHCGWWLPAASSACEVGFGPMRIGPVGHDAERAVASHQHAPAGLKPAVAAVLFPPPSGVASASGYVCTVPHAQEEALPSYTCSVHRAARPEVHCARIHEGLQ